MSFDHCDLTPIIVRLLPINLRVQLCKTYYERREIQWDTIFTKYFSTNGAVRASLEFLFASNRMSYRCEPNDENYWCDTYPGNEFNGYLEVNIGHDIKVSMAIKGSISSISITGPIETRAWFDEDYLVNLYLHVKSLKKYCARYRSDRVRGGTGVLGERFWYTLQSETSIIVEALLSNKMKKNCGLLVWQYR